MIKATESDPGLQFILKAIADGEEAKDLPPSHAFREYNSVKDKLSVEYSGMGKLLLFEIRSGI